MVHTGNLAVDNGNIVVNNGNIGGFHSHGGTPKWMV